MDNAVDEFERLARESFGGEVRALFERYYRLVAEMAENDGHFAEAARLLRGAGYSTRPQLTTGGWIDDELEGG